MAHRDRRSSEEDWFTCPHCGAEVRTNARACPECGSDEATGWSEGAGKWGAGIPTGYSRDDEFDYDEFVRREFGRGSRRHLNFRLWFLAAVLALAVAGLLFLLL